MVKIVTIPMGIGPSLLGIGAVHPYRVLDRSGAIKVVVQVVDHKVVGGRIEIAPQVKVRGIGDAEGDIAVLLVLLPDLYGRYRAQ